MARLAEPWRWNARKGWYAWVNGKRVRLASFDEGKAAAQRRLDELRTTTEPDTIPTVGTLVIAYLAHLRGRRTSGEIESQTRADAIRRLSGFAETYVDLPADQIRPHHVDAWLASRTGWGATTRHDGVGAVRSVFHWALRQGLLERDPLAAMAKPPRKPKRETIPPPAEVSRALAAALTPELRDLLAFIHATGCRPKEARTLEAKHLDRAAGVAVLIEHKTARKTGKRRVIYLTPVAAEIAYRLAAERPEGPLFLNARGNPWTHNALGLAVRRLRERAGLSDDMVAYTMRHAFITDALARGVSAALTAELAGHSDLRMLSRYSHISEHHDALREAAERIRGTTPASPDAEPQEPTPA